MACALGVAHTIILSEDETLYCFGRNKKHQWCGLDKRANGYNGDGQLGHDDNIDRNIPTKVDSLKDIQQISSGCCGSHFLANNSQNNTFVMGNNNYGQLGTENFSMTSKPIKIDSEYIPIWKDTNKVENRAKSARK